MVTKTEKTKTVLFTTAKVMKNKEKTEKLLQIGGDQGDRQLNAMCDPGAVKGR